MHVSPSGPQVFMLEVYVIHYQPRVESCFFVLNTHICTHSYIYMHIQPQGRIIYGSFVHVELAFCFVQVHQAHVTLLLRSAGTRDT